MDKYVHLIGTEQVQSAANTMKEAAHEINRAANTISEALRQHSEIMREFMYKIDEVREDGKPNG